MSVIPRPSYGTVRFQKRFLLPSDSHGFVGRLYDLSVVALHFESYEELAEYPDCKYVIDVHDALSNLTQRVESLNNVGQLLWPSPMPKSFETFFISRYDWIALYVDALLMRYISVVDCALLVTNQVFEANLTDRECSIHLLLKKGVNEKILDTLKALRLDQQAVREERNARFHHGKERTYTDDDVTFRLASIFEHHGNKMSGTDRYDRAIDLKRFFREGLVKRQKEFNSVNRRLIRRLDELYTQLAVEFEARFHPRFKNGPFATN